MRWSQTPGLAILGPALLGLAFTAAAADLSLDMAGSLPFPDDAVSADGEQTKITGLSGLTLLADDSWAAVMDNSDLDVTFTLQVSRQGEPTAIADMRTLELEA